MEHQPLNIIRSFANLHVLVVGDAILDRYTFGNVNRLCREAPVPTVTLSKRVDVPGGAANTAANIKDLGADVTLLSVIGSDLEGEMLRALLSERAVRVGLLIKQASRRTLAKQRVFASSQMIVKIDEGSAEVIDSSTERILAERLSQAFPTCDAVIVSDYGYGVVTPYIVGILAELQALYPQTLVLDSDRLENYGEVGATAVKPDYKQVVRLLGIDAVSDSDMRVTQLVSSKNQLLELLRARVAAITLDVGGALILERGSPAYRTYACPQPHSQAIGAGDTFVSAMTLALAAGTHTSAAADIASAAAAVVVSKKGTSTCTSAELSGYFVAKDKVMANTEELGMCLSFLRGQGRRIVFTNGCFDILHRGHITYLSRAKALGDVLIVGINSDDSVRRLKGAKRPVTMLDERMHVLSALSCVDYLISFEEDTSLQLVRHIRPDIFVKGGDYTLETLPEAPLVELLGGKVQILPYVGDSSTTRIIEHIRELHA